MVRLASSEDATTLPDMRQQLSSCISLMIFMRLNK